DARHARWVAFDPAPPSATALREVSGWRARLRAVREGLMLRGRRIVLRVEQADVPGLLTRGLHAVMAHAWTLAAAAVALSALVLRHLTLKRPAWRALRWSLPAFLRWRGGRAGARPRAEVATSC